MADPERYAEFKRKRCDHSKKKTEAGCSIGTQYRRVWKAKLKADPERYEAWKRKQAVAIARRKARAWEKTKADPERYAQHCEKRNARLAKKRKQKKPVVIFMNPEPIQSECMPLEDLFIILPAPPEIRLIEDDVDRFIAIIERNRYELSKLQSSSSHRDLSKSGQEPREHSADSFSENVQ